MSKNDQCYRCGGLASFCKYCMIKDDVVQAIKEREEQDAAERLRLGLPPKKRKTRKT